MTKYYKTLCSNHNDTIFNDDFTTPVLLMAGFTFLIGIFFGVLIGSYDSTDYQYKKIYCPKIYTETDQYIQCMNKPFNDTLKSVLTNK